MVGTTISHYKILEKLGEGGMGIVYKAHDTKLDRDVALKFLPHHLTATADEQARFLQEARAASALNHPNVCTIYDIAEHDGQQFIVMECIEGKTLRQMVPVQKTQTSIDYAIQIGEALHEAHSKGIVHRDVKTDNIMVNSKNQIKVMDFGLAKLKGSLKLTRTSSTVGTLAYMAPEQIQGGEVDARSDIFSFGVVLYEMLTGHMPFRGEHEAAMVYSIVNEEPTPIQKYLPEISSELVHILNRALEKDPEDRYQSVHDMVIDLRRLKKETSRVGRTITASAPSEGTTGIDQTPSKSPQLWTKRRIAFIASCLLVVCIVAAMFLLNQPRNFPRVNPDRKVKRVPTIANIGRYCALSHDGNWIAFAAFDENGKWDLYYMNSSGGAVSRVTHDATGEVIPDGCSRDGAWILYTRRVNNRPEIALVPTLGGPVRIIAHGFSSRFSPTSDTIFYIRGIWGSEPSVSGKLEVCSVGIDGNDKRVVFVDPGYTHKGGNITYSLSVSPDGKRIAWIKTFPDFSQDIITYDLQSKVESQVTSSRTLKDEVFWTHANHLIYSSYANGNFDLWMSSADGGKPLQLTQSRTDEMYGALCDDGSKLLYYEINYSGNIRSMDLTTGKVTSITSDDQFRLAVCVSPDGRYAAYTAVPSYPNWLTWRGIEIVDAKGEYPVRTISADERIAGNKVWSPEGKWIAYGRPPDSVGGTLKVCIVSPFDGTRSKVVAEAKGRPDQNIRLWWVNRDSLTWFSEMKTWICSIEDSKLTQLYPDSTYALLIQGGRYVLFHDYRIGRQGWWICGVPSTLKGREAIPRKISDPFDVLLDPRGEFLVYSPKPGELCRISLPDGKTTRLPFAPPLVTLLQAITRDGKSLVYLEGQWNSKLMLWENPFIKE